MPSNKFEWLNRVKAVEREHSAVRYATDHLLTAAKNDSTILDRVLRVRDVQDAVERLEGTYVIRLFAEFETSLRTFWVSSRRAAAPSRTRDLLDGVAAKCKVPHDKIQDAHTVREFRNVLVHERDDDIGSVPIATARRYLCVFLSFLPMEW
jgi:hypothetical protein